MYNTKNLEEDLGTYESMKTVSSKKGRSHSGCHRVQMGCTYSEALACQDWRNLFVSMHAFDTLVLYNYCVHACLITGWDREGGHPGILTKIQGFQSTCPGICVASM